MASFGHVAVGLAAGRFQAGEGGRLRPTLVLTALATFPDLDVVGWWLGMGRNSIWLHRGALHSLVFAASAALLALLFLPRRPGWRGFAAALVTCLATALSHGLLDTFTYGGSGVMLLWPFSPERFLSPWHLLAASPIGRRLLSPHGLRLVVGEAVFFSPLLAFALWPRRRPLPAAAERPT